MRLFSLLPFAAAGFSFLIGILSLFRRRSFATWCFLAGMVAFAVESVSTGLALRATSPDELIGWMTFSFVTKSLTPGIWLAFSLAYSRGDYPRILQRWRVVLAVFALLPVALAIGFRGTLFLAVADTAATDVVRMQLGPIARVLNVVLLVALVLILTNLEQTLRSAIGTMRWQIKFVVLALGVIFGARLYVRSQAILFSAPDITLWGIESGALLIGCLLLSVTFVRAGWAEIEVYPSRAVLRSSLTVVIVGAYLFAVGVLAQVVRLVGGAEIFQLQSFVVLAGIAGLAMLLLSDRARRRIELFVGRHFRKAQHDSVQVWTAFSQRLASITNQSDLSSVSARLIAETFDVLSITIWLLHEESGRLTVGASSSRAPGDQSGALSASPAVLAGLQSRAAPFDLEKVSEAWAEELRALNPPAFKTGGNRLCVPLTLGEQAFGAVVLADRVSGAAYTPEELELLQCIGAQMTAALQGLRLAGEVARGRELDAFRTMSAFFVHDLKNAAASLTLTLKNLPLHFDDPAFREDALRAIGNAARRMDDIIARLSALRERPELHLERADLNQLVNDALEGIHAMPNVVVAKDLNPVPSILADRERMQSVVTNLVLNARDAVDAGGRIEVRTESQGDRVVLSVADNGRGMSPAFLRDSLFRPFQSTKQKGLGIGLFQSRWIVQAHGGGMQVTSEIGKGTTFLVRLPVSGEQS